MQINFSTITFIVSYLYLAYFLSINFFYFFLNTLAFLQMRRHLFWSDIDSLPQIYSGFELSIGIIAPAHNEEETIAASIHSLLQLNYPNYEVVVVNDGSTDKTVEVMIAEFKMIPFPEATREELISKPIRGIYRSTLYPNLKLIDKENGGKADALNAGINSVRSKLFCCIDADSVLQPDSLQHVVKPFLEDPSTIAAGGTIRIANGCEIEQGVLKKVGLPKNYLSLMQITEYLRAFLFGRLGWSPLNAMLVISGAFGLFRKEVVVAAGGYRTDTVGEDMEMVVRLHKLMRFNKIKYKICYVPNPICWTEAPEILSTLKNQRMRWQRGLCETLWLNKELLFNFKSGFVGWFAFPFMLFFEALEPFVQVSGYIFTAFCYYYGIFSAQVALAFLFVVIGLGMLLSVNALLLEELSFHRYPKIRQIVTLFFAAIVENLGYRQINSWWRLVGILKFIFRAKPSWGVMKRKGFSNKIYEKNIKL